MQAKPTILVIEDEAALVTLLRYNLERDGYRVVEARDGEEALIVAAEENPDLILLDWALPNLSGIEVCRRLRMKAESRNTPIIMLTARGEESDRIRGLDTGADDYVVKPFSMTEMLARIRAVTPAEVQAVARKYFSDDSLTVAQLDPLPVDPQARAKAQAAGGHRH